MALITSVYLIKLVMKTLSQYHTQGSSFGKSEEQRAENGSWHRLVTCLFCLSLSPGYEVEFTVDQFVHFVLF